MVSILYRRLQLLWKLVADDRKERTGHEMPSEVEDRQVYSRDCVLASSAGLLLLQHMSSFFLHRSPCT